MRRRSPPSIGASRRRMAAVVQLHALVGSKGFEYRITLRLGQAAEIEFVVIAAGTGPIARWPAALGRGQRFRQRTGIGRASA